MKKLFKGCLISMACLIVLAIVGVLLLQRNLEEAYRNAGKVEDWDESNGVVLKDLRYGEFANNTFDLYLPKGETKDGLLLFVHGGSWMGGDKNEFEYACRRYTKKGYATATMNYSFINDETRRVTLPEIDREVTACVQAIEKELKNRQISVSQMAIGGYSAGTQVALTFALKHRDDSPFPVRFAIGQVGSVDLDNWFKFSEEDLRLAREDSDKGKEKRHEITRHFYTIYEYDLAPSQLFPDSIAAIHRQHSPVRLIDSLSAPVILAYGEKDFLAPPEIRKGMVSAYQAAGVPCISIVYPNSGHGLSDDPDCAEKLQAAVKDYLQKYFRREQSE